MIAGIFGNLSSGKTALAVKYCYDNWKFNNKDIISNIKLNFPNKWLSMDTLIYKAFNEATFFNKSILFIDELHNIVDARRSSSDLNQKFTQFITQVGKLDCHVIYTSQILSSQIDLRIRELCDVYLFTMRMVMSKGILEPVIFGDRYIDGDIYFNVDLLVKILGGASYIPYKFVIKLDDYYKCYNSKEIVVLDRDKYLKKSNYNF